MPLSGRAGGRTESGAPSLAAVPRATGRGTPRSVSDAHAGHGSRSTATRGTGGDRPLRTIARHSDDDALDRGTEVPLPPLCGRASGLRPGGRPPGAVGRTRCTTVGEPAPGEPRAERALFGGRKALAPLAAHPGLRRRCRSTVGAGMRSKRRPRRGQAQRRPGWRSESEDVSTPNATRGGAALGPGVGARPRLWLTRGRPRSCPPPLSPCQSNRVGARRAGSLGASSATRRPVRRRPAIGATA